MNYVATLKGIKYISFGLYFKNKGKATNVLATDSFIFVISEKSLNVNFLLISIIFA